jgi:uncharacterized protein (TIGR03067 family)
MNANLLLGTALALGAPGLKDSPKKDLDIVGEWVLESITSAVKLRQFTGDDIVYTFGRDGKWTIHQDGKKDANPNRGYKADSSAKPATIDWIPDVTAATPSREGIYKVEGDTLTMCIGLVKTPRPAAFVSTAESQSSLYVLKRRKKD